MASAAEILALRAMIAQPENVPPYDDATLSAIIDGNTGDLNKSAWEIWTSKAASVANLVDISEGGSSRKMGDLYEQYLSMARVYGERVTDGSPGATGRGTRISRLTR